MSLCRLLTSIFSAFQPVKGAPCQDVLHTHRFQGPCRHPGTTPQVRYDQTPQKHTSLKSNIDTQNDAMFEAGDTSKKPSFWGIYVRFRGCTYQTPDLTSGGYMTGCLGIYDGIFPLNSSYLGTSARDLPYSKKTPL